MKKIAVITTYPHFGSQNIGDQLITDSLIAMIKEIYPLAEIVTFWREDKFEEVSSELKHSDHIIFACLAIRPDFATKEYPYIQRLIDMDIPMSIISAGTSLDVSGTSDLDGYLSKNSIEVLKKLDNKVKAFGVRGALSYKFLKDLGLNNIVHTGDVAFYSKPHRNKPFEQPGSIKEIVISDPHRAVAYKNSFIELVSQLKSNFPDANLTVALHGKNPLISKLCTNFGLKCESIYKNKEFGLEIYDNADMHIGFRVHAHVSMLKRRKISYLLEQDGRGCDYGLTIPIKISVPNYQRLLSNLHHDFISDLLCYRSKHNFKQAPISDAKILISLVLADLESSFGRFKSLHVDIDGFCDKIAEQLKNVINI
ncbi:polysaccharide pyruvyl transferase family protein [Shewanella litorisediminis]|uniref:Polysaccharide pyruvyl transferase family protein n=1 Tax=Shewanella litorisediminis TaxID=1173586 RepID=A0ABX7FZS9_9GAMM|nr:polysaccharide pyruvyl transferase family protein [Shewanella litorisediminis]MCL2919638.1 polysaccharide pyruvyl transferase family protein [Shewanella litorisediminis]QRH00529.1 polysaccharide pyruvyl transferase family protein [Shewanella litorisediminis]